MSGQLTRKEKDYCKQGSAKSKGALSELIMFYINGSRISLNLPRDSEQQQRENYAHACKALLMLADTCYDEKAKKKVHDSSLVIELLINAERDTKVIEIGRKHLKRVIENEWTDIDRHYLRATVHKVLTVSDTGLVDGMIAIPEFSKLVELLEEETYKD